MESKHHVGPAPVRHPGLAQAHTAASSAPASTTGPRTSALAVAGQAPATAGAARLAERTVVFWGARAGPAARPIALGRHILGAELTPSAFAQSQAELSRSPELGDFCAWVEGRVSEPLMSTEVIRTQSLRLIRLLGGPAIGARDLDRLLCASHPRLLDSDLPRLVHELGGRAISRERLNQVLDACLRWFGRPFYSGVEFPARCPELMAHLQRCGLLSGPQQEAVLSFLLNDRRVVMEDRPGHILAHLVPSNTLAGPAREQWEADLASACALVTRSQASLGTIFGSLALALISGGRADALSALWTAAARCWRTMPPQRAGNMAAAMAFAHGEDLEPAIRRLLSTADVPGTAAVLPEACVPLFRAWRPERREAYSEFRQRASDAIRKALVGKPPSVQLAVWLAWHGDEDNFETGAIDGRHGRLGEAQPESAGLDTPDLSDRNLCLQLLDDPLCALSHAAQEDLDRFETLATACAARRARGLPDPDLAGGIPEAQRDAVLLRLPSIAPWTLSPQRLTELHAHFMARIRADAGWMEGEVEVQAGPAAPARSRDAKAGRAATAWRPTVDEVLLFYEGFLQAYGLHLTGPEPFPKDRPGRAWQKAAELVTALRPLVRQASTHTRLHPFERGRVEMFKSMLDRVMPLLLPQPEQAHDLAIADALAHTEDQARLQSAFSSLSRQFALTAPDPARVVRHALARCTALGDARLRSTWWIAAATGLLQPFTAWPRERSRGVLRDGLMPALMEHASQSWLRGVLLVRALEPITTALGDGPLTQLDAALDPRLAVGRWVRFETVEALLGEAQLSNRATEDAMVLRILVAKPSDDPWLERELLKVASRYRMEFEERVVREESSRGRCAIS